MKHDAQLHHPIRLLYSGYSDQRFLQRKIALLQAYFDDSIKSAGAGKNWLFLAGYVAEASRWIEFSNDWQSALAYGRPIEYFKASECNAARKQFRGWGRLDREIKLGHLAAVISRCELPSFYVAVELAAFERMFQKDGVPWGFRTPYWLAFEVLMVKITQYFLIKGGVGPIDFIFDEQGQIQRSVTSLFECLREAQPPEFKQFLGSTPIFRNDRDVVALQAADMLAWLTQRESKNGHLTPKSNITQKILGDENAYFVVDESVLSILADNRYSQTRLAEISSKSEWRNVLDIIDAEASG